MKTRTRQLPFVERFVRQNRKLKAGTAFREAATHVRKQLGRDALPWPQLIDDFYFAWPLLVLRISHSDEIRNQVNELIRQAYPPQRFGDQTLIGSPGRSFVEACCEFVIDEVPDDYGVTERAWVVALPNLDDALRLRDLYWIRRINAGFSQGHKELEREYERQFEALPRQVFMAYFPGMQRDDISALRSAASAETTRIGQRVAVLGIHEQERKAIRELLLEGITPYKTAKTLRPDLNTNTKEWSAWSSRVKYEARLLGSLDLGGATPPTLT